MHGVSRTWFAPVHADRIFCVASRPPSSQALVYIHQLVRTPCSMLWAIATCWSGGAYIVSPRAVDLTIYSRKKSDRLLPCCKPVNHAMGPWHVGIYAACLCRYSWHGANASNIRLRGRGTVCVLGVLLRTS